MQLSNLILSPVAIGDYLVRGTGHHQMFGFAFDSCLTQLKHQHILRILLFELNSIETSTHAKNLSPSRCDEIEEGLNVWQ